jgi:hypothetical protein
VKSDPTELKVPRSVKVPPPGRIKWRHVPTGRDH